MFIHMYRLVDLFTSTKRGSVAEFLKQLAACEADMKKNASLISLTLDELPALRRLHDERTTGEKKKALSDTIARLEAMVKAEAKDAQREI